MTPDANRTGTTFACLSILALILVALPTAPAGTQEAPEISDPDNDSDHPDPNRDIINVWIEPIHDLEKDPINPVAIRFNLQIPGEFQHAPAFFALHEAYRINFKTLYPGGINGEGDDSGEFAPNSKQAYIMMRPSNAATSGSTQQTLPCAFGIADSEGGFQDLASETSLGSHNHEGDIFWCDLPLALIGMSNRPDTIHLGGLYATQSLIARGPTNAGDQIGQNVITTFDRAPNSGFGTDFMLPLEWPADTVVLNDTYEDILGDRVAIHEDFNQTPTTVKRTYNWTTTATNVTIAYDAATAAGEVSLEIRDGLDLTVLEGTLSSNFTDEQVLDVAAGNWTIIVTYTDYPGTFNLTIDPPVPFPFDDEDQDDDHDDHGDDTNNTDGEPGKKGKESPGTGALLATLAIIGAAAIMRRRRN